MFQKLKNFLFINSSTTQTILKNTFWLFFGQLSGRFLRAIIVIYAARELGAESWGAFSYAIGVTAFLTIFGDIGINALITKETSRNPALQTQYIATALFIKLILLATLTIGALKFTPYFTNIEEALKLIPILIFVFVFDSLRDLGSAIARALEQMEIEASTNALTNLFIVIFGIIALQLHTRSLGLAYAYSAGSCVGLIITFYILRKHFLHLTKHFNPALIKPILETAWPFGLMGMMGAIMLNTDILMLGWMRTPSEVGYYSAAQKIILLLYVLPGLLASSTFPALARLAKTNIDAAQKILNKSVRLMLLIACPLSIFGILLAHTIISIIFGVNYLPAAATFQILLLSLVLVFPGTILGNALFAYDGQKYFLRFVIISTFSNAILNYILIKPFGIEGAALSTIITQLITNTFVYFKVKKITGFRI